MIFFFAFSPTAQALEDNTESDLIKVYVFLHESCRISQYYTPQLQSLSEQYASERIQFEGVFPNQKTKTEAILAFQDKHSLSFNMLIDEQQYLTKKLGATVTSEVIVYNESKDEILYRGRIDDSYFRVGKRRQVSTSSELADVLSSIQKGEPVAVKFEDAIGCFIQKI